MKLKNNIEEYVHLFYTNFGTYKFKDFENHLTYPLYEKYKNGGKYSQLDCSEYREKLKILIKSFLFVVFYLKKLIH